MASAADRTSPPAAVVTVTLIQREREKLSYGFFRTKQYEGKEWYYPGPPMRNYMPYANPTSPAWAATAVVDTAAVAFPPPDTQLRGPVIITDLSTVEPPHGFEWTPDSVWTVPDHFEYKESFREAPITRPARSRATTLKSLAGAAATVSSPTMPTVAPRHNAAGTFDWMMQDDVGKMICKVLGPQGTPIKTDSELRTERLLSLAWIASNAAYKNTDVPIRPAGAVAKVGAMVRKKPGVCSSSADGGLLRVSQYINDYQVEVQSAANLRYNAPPPQRDAGIDAAAELIAPQDLDLAALVEFETWLGCYSTSFPFARVCAAEEGDDPMSTTHRHHHVFMELPSSSLTASPGTEHADLLVFAARGSRNPLTNLADWRTNLSLGGGAAATHEGFSARADTIPLHPMVDHLRDGGAVLLTGHSLGSGVSELIAQRLIDVCMVAPEDSMLRLALTTNRILFIGFASPAVGTAGYNYLHAQHARRFFHITNENDVVPHISNISAIAPEIFNVGMSALVKAAKASVQNPAVQFGLEFASQLVGLMGRPQVTRNMSPLEPARGYHIARSISNSISCVFVDRGNAPDTLRTSAFIARVKSISDTVATVVDHLLEAYDYVNFVEPTQQPLNVPRAGLSTASLAWYLPDMEAITLDGRLYHQLSQRSLSLVATGESARLLSCCNGAAIATTVNGGAQSRMPGGRVVAVIGATPSEDRTTMYFEAPDYQIPGTVVTVHLTPRYGDVRGMHRSSLLLSGPVERAVDMSVLSTLNQALFLSIGADCANPFTRGLGEKLVTLERLAAQFARLRCMEGPDGSIVHPKVGGCRVVMPPHAAPRDREPSTPCGDASQTAGRPVCEVFLVWPQDDVTYKVLDHNGDLKPATPAKLLQEFKTYPKWFMYEGVEAYDFQPAVASPSSTTPALDLLGVKLAFHNGTYRLLKSGGFAAAIEAGGGFLSRSHSVTLKPTNELEAAPFLIFSAAAAPFELLPPCSGVSNPVIKCARVVVQRETNSRALDAATFVSIVQNPDVFLQQLPEDETKLAAAAMTVETEDKILTRDLTTRIVEVLGQHGVLPPAVPINKLLREAERCHKERAKTVEPPVTRYFFCGMATITSWILDVCSVVLHDTTSGRSSWLWRLLFSGDSDSSTAVDKTYTAQLELLCSLIDDDRFETIRQCIANRRMGRFGEQMHMKQLHKLLLDYHDVKCGDADVNYFGANWSGEGAPLKTREVEKGSTRDAVVRLMYAFMVTVAKIDRDVSSCSAVAAFGLKGAGKSTLLHALSHGRMNPPTRGTELSTLEAVAFYGQTPSTYQVCVIDCPGTNEDRHELRALQRLMFGVVKLIFVVQSLNKEAQNQLDVLQPVLASANPEATVFVIFTHFATRFAATWNDQVACGFPIDVYKTAAGGDENALFEFDGHVFVGGLRADLSRYACAAGGGETGATPSPASLFVASMDGGLALLAPGPEVIGVFKKRVDGAAELPAVQPSSKISIRVRLYTPPTVTLDRFATLQSLRAMLSGSAHRDKPQLIGRVTACLIDIESRGATTLSQENRSLLQLLQQLLADELEENDTAAFVYAIADQRLLSQGQGASNTSAAAGGLKPYSVTAAIPLDIINGVRASVLTAVTRMKEACPSLRRMPLHRCVIFQPRSDQLLGDGLFSSGVVRKLAFAINTDVANFTEDGQSMRSALALDVMTTTGKVRIMRPTDPEHTKVRGASIAALFEHPRVAARTIFDEDDLAALLLSDAGAPTLNRHVFQLLCGLPAL